MNHIDKIVQARSNVKAAQDALTKAVADAFPKGCAISVSLGKANICANVEAHGSDHHAGELTVKNQRTGKRRTFHVLFHQPNRIGV